MAGKLPIDFEQKVKQPPAVDGKGYPYQISAKDLMADFNYLNELLPDGVTKGDMLQWDGSAWIVVTAPSQSGTYVLGAIDGELQWIATEECA